MDTKVQVKSMTSTDQAVLVTLGTLGAFFIGVAMIVAPLRAIIAPEPIDGPVFGEMAGWPKPIDGFYQSTPLAINLDSDAKLEIVQGARYKIYAYDDNGALMAGWPYNFGDDSFVLDATGAANLDSDPQTEIVVATSRWWGTGQNKLYVFNHDGTLVPGWPKNLPAQYSGGTAPGSPAIGDIDNDGRSEIILTSSDSGQSKLYALEGDGTFVTGWPVNAVGFAWNQPVIASINHENRVVYGSRHELTILNSNGTPYGCFPYQLSEPYTADINQISVADLGGNIGTAIVFMATNNDGQAAIHAMNIDCQELPGWPYTLEGLQTPSGVPAIGDLDNDGNKEIVFKAFESLNQGSDLLILNNDGTLKRSIPMVQASGYPWYGDFSHVSLADINGDNKLDILGLSNYVLAWDSKGNMLPNFPINFMGSNNSEVVAADIDADNVSELVFTEYAAISKIHVYELGIFRNGSTWTQSRHDAQNTGLAEIKVKATCSDTDGGKKEFVLGTVSGVSAQNVPYSSSDVCVDNSVLEKSCYQVTGETGWYVTADLISCTYGCANGACRTSTSCTGCDGTQKQPACCNVVGDQTNPDI